MALLPRSFFQRGAEEVAKDLLGKVLAADVEGVRRRARIVEAEAYVGPHDLASHSRHGPTARNASMFGPAARTYVYLVYGMHHCLNVVAGDRDGQAVLLRAAEPLDGWAARLSGPALLAKAFGLTREHDGLDVLRGPVRIHDGPAPALVAATPRVGVGYAQAWAAAPLRFLDAASPHVSGSRAGSRDRKRLDPLADGSAWRVPATPRRAS